MAMSPSAVMEQGSIKDAFLRDDLPKSLDQHAWECYRLFRRRIADLELTLSWPSSLSDAHLNFKLWANDFHLFDQANTSLDYMLRYEPTVTPEFHKLFSKIEFLLNELTTTRKRPWDSGDAKIPDCWSDTDVDQGSQTRIRKKRKTSAAGGLEATKRDDEATELDDDGEDNKNDARLSHIAETICQLRVLCNTYYDPANVKRNDVLAEYKTDKETDDTIIELGLLAYCFSRFKYPGAVKTLPWMLAETTVMRSRRLCYQRLHPAPLRIQPPETDSSMVQCPLCTVILEFDPDEKPTLWRDHLIKDLEPYFCLNPRCAPATKRWPRSLTFGALEPWMSHMENGHEHMWMCTSGPHKRIMFKEKHEFLEHMEKEHHIPKEDLHFWTIGQPIPVFENILECPFGDGFRAEDEALDSFHIIPSSILEQHIAAHMEEMALLPLLKLHQLPRHGHQKSKAMASDQLSEEDGVAASRASTLDGEALAFMHKHANGAWSIFLADEMSSKMMSDSEKDDEAGIFSSPTAVRDDNRPLAQFFIENRASFRSRTDNGETVLHYAVLCESKDLLKLLLSHSHAMEITSWKDGNGQTALHYAAKKGFSEGIVLLVDHGAVMDIPDDDGYSPYLYAVIHDMKSAVDAFLSLGVDVDSTSADGKSALCWAVCLGHFSIAKSLLENGATVMPLTQDARPAPLTVAAGLCDLRMIQLLLDSGADPNHRDREGWSAIHSAAEEGRCQVVSLLLTHGADVDSVSSSGASPLHCAANGGHSEMVSLLLQQGADPCKSTCHGWTPLHHAAFMGYANVIQPLLEAGWLTSNLWTDDVGCSVLRLAVHGRHLDTVEILLRSSLISDFRLHSGEAGLTAYGRLMSELDADAHKTIGNLAFDESRCCGAATRLCQAAQGGSMIMAEFLLERGHSANAGDSGNRTALYYAARRGGMPMLNLLLRNGADPRLLPRGCSSWEDLIPDGPVLQRLRETGYTKPVLDKATHEQIRRALGRRANVGHRHNLRSKGKARRPALRKQISGEAQSKRRKNKHSAAL